ncbi:RNA 2'-phosphotransferase [Chloroflexi bacterium TSY]|nr:RNA 2'-phosphotransferase [Chloroflexi bacterium TSY]
MNKQLIRLSKFMSLVLRHKPEQIGLTLDHAGWASVSELIARATQAGIHLTPQLIDEVVSQNDKQRFALSPDRQRIRANQGHSIQVELGLTPVAPPELLYHGTATRFLDSILQQGLKSGKRHHVHLSAHVETAIKVGKRHGKPTVLNIASGAMHSQGYTFYQSENGVWLTNFVPTVFISIVQVSAISP